MGVLCYWYGYLFSVNGVYMYNAPYLLNYAAIYFNRIELPSEQPVNVFQTQIRLQIIMQQCSIVASYTLVACFIT